MTTTLTLPRGIRNHNPGNLNRSCWHGSRTRRIDGFAVFGSDEEGLLNLAACIGQFYFDHRLNTVASFVSRYAPASENDLMSYEMFIASWMNFRRDEIASRDLSLQAIPQAAWLLLGIVRIECGVPPAALKRGHEWFSNAQAMRAVSLSGYWGAPS